MRLRILHVAGGHSYPLGTFKGRSITPQRRIKWTFPLDMFRHLVHLEMNISHLVFCFCLAKWSECKVKQQAELHLLLSNSTASYTVNQQPQQQSQTRGNIFSRQRWSWTLIVIFQLWAWLSGLYLDCTASQVRRCFSIKTNILYIMTIGTEISQGTRGKVITVIQTHMKTGAESHNIVTLESPTINEIIADNFIDYHIKFCNWRPQLYHNSVRKTIKKGTWFTT